MGPGGVPGGLGAVRVSGSVPVWSPEEGPHLVPVEKVFGIGIRRFLDLLNGFVLVHVSQDVPRSWSVVQVTSPGRDGGGPGTLT